MNARHQALFNRFSSQYDSALVEKWGKMIDDWDADISLPCPYEEPKKSKSDYDLVYYYTKRHPLDKTTAQVNKELAKEELEEVKRGDFQLHEITPATFLRYGFELEEQQ
jgi:hypothetical protein